MTLITGRVEAIFADAYATHADALECLAANDLHGASGKAWCATVRATDGLILAWTGEEPQSLEDTERMLRELGLRDDRIECLILRYAVNYGDLYAECFLLGYYEPVSFTEELIRETVDYVRDAERLALESAPQS